MLCNIYMFWLSVLKKVVSKRDVHSYFITKENESKRSRISIPETIVPISKFLRSQK